MTDVLAVETVVVASPEVVVAETVGVAAAVQEVVTDDPVVVETVVVASPVVVESVVVADVAVIETVQVLGVQGPPGTVADTFETVSKNLEGTGYTLVWDAGLVSSVAYASGVVKSFVYSGGLLSSVVLSGATPGGIDLVKSFTYSGVELTGVVYS